jgi:hypothetical protein
MPIPKEVQELLSLYPTEVKGIALAARDLVMRVLPDVTEEVDRSGGLIGYGYGPGYKGAICTLILSQRGVKLGIVRGSELPDPAGLLEGKGKVHRYVDLRQLADLKKPGLKPLIEAGVAAWTVRNKPSK